MKSAGTEVPLGPVIHKATETTSKVTATSEPKKPIPPLSEKIKQPDDQSSKVSASSRYWKVGIGILGLFVVVLAFKSFFR